MQLQRQQRDTQCVSFGYQKRINKERRSKAHINQDDALGKEQLPAYIASAM